MSNNIIKDKYNIKRQPGGYFTPLHLAEIPVLGKVVVKQYGYFPEPNAVPSTGQYDTALAEKILADQGQVREVLANCGIKSQRVLFVGLFPINDSLESVSGLALELCEAGCSNALQVPKSSQGCRMVVIEEYLGDCLRTLIRKTQLGADREVEIVRQALIVITQLAAVAESVALDAKPDNFVVRGDEVFCIDVMPPKVDGEYATDPKLLAVFPNNDPTQQYYSKKIEQYHLKEARRERYLEYLLKYLREVNLEHLYRIVLASL